MKETKDLIKELALDKSALKSDLSPILKSVIAFVGVILIYVAVTFCYSPMNFNVVNNAHIVEMILMSILIFHVLLLGFTALIPGAKMRMIFLSFLTFLGLLFLTQIYQANSHPIYAAIRPNCEFEAIGVSILTTFVGHFYLKRFPFSRHQIFSTLIFYGPTLLATLILHSACKSEWLHVLSCHLISPFIVPTAYLMMRKKS